MIKAHDNWIFGYADELPDTRPTTIYKTTKYEIKKLKSYILIIPEMWHTNDASSGAKIKAYLNPKHAERYLINDLKEITNEENVINPMLDLLKENKINEMVLAYNNYFGYSDVRYYEMEL